MTRRRIRIGQVLTSLWDGGLERTVLQVAEGLPHDRFETRIYPLIDHNPWAMEFTRRGIEVRSFGARNRGGARTALRNCAATLDLARCMRRDRIDVAVVHDFFPGTLGRVSSLLAGVPRRVAVLHSTYDWLGRPHGAVNHLLGRWTDAVVAVSAAARDDSLRRDRLSPGKYRIVHNGVDENLFRRDDGLRLQVRRELGLSEDAVAIGYIAGIRESKRQLDLIQAAEELRREFQGLHLVLVGTVRPHESRYADLVERAISGGRASGWIHRLEDRRDIPAVLSAMDVYAAPSGSEGFGLALVEAMMCELPICCSDIAAFREIAAQGDALKLHPTGDVRALRDNLADLIRTPSLRGELGRMARARAVAAFSQSTMLSAWRALFEDLAGAR